MDLLPVHEDIVEFVNAGVSGFITKDATLEDLVSTIRGPYTWLQIAAFAHKDGTARAP